MNIQTQILQMAFRSCLCLICHTTSSSPLIFQELELLLPAQRHKECQGHGADREGKARNGKRRVGNSSVCITCWRKGAVGEETKEENGSEGEGSGFSQLEKWEGSGIKEKMTADKGLAEESSWAGDTKVPHLPRLEGHIICHWKDQFPRLATKPLLLSRTLKAEAKDDPSYLSEGRSSTRGNKQSQCFHSLLCEKFLEHY